MEEKKKLFLEKIKNLKAEAKCNNFTDDEYATSIASLRRIQAEKRCSLKSDYGLRDIVLYRNIV